MLNNKILITGCCGFVGRNITAFLKKKKFIIDGIGHGNWNKKTYKSWGYNYLINKNINFKNLIKLKENYNYIIHCGGTGLQSKSMESFKKNITTLQEVLEYIIKKNKKIKLIFISSVAVNAKKKIIEENLEHNPISNYGLNKQLCENIIKFYSNKYQLDSLILRVSSLYGNDLKKQFIYDACNKLRNNKNIFTGNGDEIRDWLHINDFCNLIYKILIKGFYKFNIMNCGSGETYSIKYILNLLCKLFKIKIIPRFNSEGIENNPIMLIPRIKKIKKYRWKPKISIYKGLRRYVLQFK